MSEIIDLDYLIGKKVYFGEPLTLAELALGKKSLAEKGAYFYSKQPDFKEDVKHVKSENWVFNCVKNDCLIYLSRTYSILN